MSLNNGIQRRQRGISLIESLVAFAVVSLGAVSVIRLQKELRLGADVAAQRVDAARVGRSDIERQRAVAGIATPAPLPSRTVDTVPGHNTRYTITGSADAIDTPRSRAATAAQVAVSWPDATGVLRDVTYDTVVGQASPTLSAALAIRAVDAPPARIAGRSPLVPAQAVDVGRGRSAWQPDAAERTVWIFDNGTGRIVGRCARTSATTDAALTADTIADCADTTATVLSGVVRTSLSAPPDASHADDPPVAMEVVLTLDVPAHAAPPRCTTEAQRSVEAVFRDGSATVQRRQAVADDATPASIGAVRWTDLGDRFVAYRCVVVTPPGGWSGRTTIVPAPDAATGTATPAWRIGATARDRRVCRFVPAPSAGRSSDANERHPADYRAVARSLPQQNFLLVRGDQSCPGPAEGDGEAATEPHQP